MTYQTEGRRRQAQKIQERWKDPEYRARMIEKQSKLGYRTYGTGIFYKTNQTRRKK